MKRIIESLREKLEESKYHIKNYGNYIVRDKERIENSKREIVVIETIKEEYEKYYTFIDDSELRNFLKEETKGEIMEFDFNIKQLEKNIEYTACRINDYSQKIEKENEKIRNFERILNSF